MDVRGSFEWEEEMLVAILHLCLVLSNDERLYEICDEQKPEACIGDVRPSDYEDTPESFVLCLCTATDYEPIVYRARLD